MKRIGLLLAAGAFFSSMAQAELISTDWKVEGDGYSTLDTTSGKEWLDLTLTSGMTYNQVAEQLGEGGQFDGWRLPTEEEVHYLIDNSIIDDGVIQYADYSTNSSSTYTSLFLNALGSYIGLHEELDSDFVGFSGIYTSMALTYKSRNEYSKNVAVTYYGMSAGVYLVSDGGMTLGSTTDPIISGYQGVSSVNAPLAFGAIGLILAGAGLRRRKV
jgi:hypothetical protein